MGVQRFLPGQLSCDLRGNKKKNNVCVCVLICVSTGVLVTLVPALLSAPLSFVFDPSAGHGVECSPRPRGCQLGMRGKATDLRPAAQVLLDFGADDADTEITDVRRARRFPSLAMVVCWGLAAMCASGRPEASYCKFDRPLAAKVARPKLEAGSSSAGQHNLHIPAGMRYTPKCLA